MIKKITIIGFRLDYNNEIQIMMPSRVSNNNNSYHQNNESNPAMIPFLNSEKIF